MRRYVVIPADDYPAMEFDADGIIINSGILMLYDDEMNGIASFSANNMIAVYEKDRCIPKE